MSASSNTTPVSDSVAKVNDEVAVGSDLDFERRWWVFEKCLWTFFLLLIAATVAGCFGRGFLSKAHLRAADGSIEIQYERIARYGTPAVMTVVFAPDTLHDGNVRLWASDELRKGLGTQRTVPQPAESRLDAGGVEYTFPAGAPPYSAEFALQPRSPGFHGLVLSTPGRHAVSFKIFVLP